VDLWLVIVILVAVVALFVAFVAYRRRRLSGHLIAARPTQVIRSRRGRS
jgi:hypothetical protein